MEVDLFGERISPPKKPRKHLDIFDPGDDLSPGERLIVGGFLVDLAANIMEHDKKGAERLRLEADRYCACGREAMVLQCPKDFSRYFVRLFCHARICERCSRILVKELKRSLMPVLAEAMRQDRRGFVLSQVTLTVTSKRFGSLPDRAGIKRLYRESSELLKLFFGKWVARRSKTGKVVEIRRGKRSVKPGEDSRKFLGAGWVATSEVGHDNNNLHIHALTYGPIRSWRNLRHEWSMITGDSFGVDIRQKSLQDAVNYVLKYIAKPPRTDSYSRLADYTYAIKGSRRLRTGGIFYNRVRRVKRDRQDSTCIYCSSRLLLDGYAPDWEKCGHIDLYAENRALSRLPKPVVQKVITAIPAVGPTIDLPF
jgi:hypothetical protein